MRSLIVRLFLLSGLFFPALAAAVTPMVVAGVLHTVALKSDGTVETWGNNGLGQLGDGTTLQRVSRVMVPGLSEVIAVAAGYYHTVALKSDGSVVAWGDNNYGQLGDGTTTNRLTPVAVPGLTNVVAIAAGLYHTVALKFDGTVVAWGYNFYGQLGDGTTTSRPSPVTVSGLTGIVEVAAKGWQSVALKSDSTVVAWGSNSSGQLGDGTTTQRQNPVVVSGLSGVVEVSAGGGHTVALQSDGTVKAWGNNSSGQLGDGTTTQHLSPVVVPGLSAAAVVAGSSLSIAIKSDGTVETWGDNSFGQLGIGTTTPSLSPVVVPGLAGVVAVSSNFYHTMAIQSDGSVMAWGWNGNGQLGDGTRTDRWSPVSLPGFSLYKTSQALSFGAAPTVVVGGTDSVSATASSGLAVSFTSSTPAVCTIAGTAVTGIVTGTCTIAANQAGDTNYNAAAQVTQSFTVVDTAPNTFTFADQSGVMLSTVITSTVVRITGINAVAGWTATGGTACVSSVNNCSCDVADYAANGTVSYGQYLCARHTSSASLSTATDTLVTVGGVSDTFTSTTVAVAPTAPDAPIIGSAIASNAQAWVSFSAPAYDGGSPITGYTVTSNPADGTDSGAGTTNLTHTITGLSNGTAYTFTVHATNALGDSVESAASASVIPAATVPVTISGTTFTDNGDGTVTDSTTGLSWMRCAIGQPWNGVACIGTADTYTWNPAMALTSTYAGHSDWRMPSPWELQTIVDYSTANPAINSTAFPATPAGIFWSAASYSPDSGYKWSVDFGYGSAFTFSNYDYVRLVRGGQPAGSLTTPTADFTDNSDGTVTHLKTGLTWMRCAMGQAWDGATCTGAASTYTWDQAVALTSGFNGQTDWRLPSEQELGSLVEYGASSPAINSTLFPATPLDDFWSASTFVAYPAFAWSVNFSDGYSFNNFKLNSYSVRLVRGGQNFGSFALSLSIIGNGLGVVTSNPAGIACGATCTTNFNAVIGSVTLTATPYSGSTFTGWSGACSGTGDCTVTMDAAKNVTANFYSANDLVPDPFSFVDQNAVTLSSEVISTPVLITGMDAVTSWMAVGGTACVSSGNDCACDVATYANTGTIANNQYMCARHTSAASYASATDTRVTVGGISDTYTSTTLVALPGAPTAVTAMVGNTQATVIFTAPASNGGAAIDGYTVTSSPAGGVDSNAGTTALTHTITGLTNGTAYTFSVTAHTSAGTSVPSAASNSVIPDIQPIIINPSDDAPLYTCSGCTLLSNGGALTISGYIQGAVKFPASPISSTVTHAELSLNPYGLPLSSLSIDVYGFSSNTGLIDAASANAGTYLGTWTLPANLGYGQDAYFDVTAFVAANASAPYLGFNLRAQAGLGTFSSIEYNYGHPAQLFVIMSSMSGAVAPNAPTDVTASGGIGEATVSFNIPDSNGDAEIDGYTVISNPVGGTDSNAGTTSLVHIITGLTNGTSYTFTVTAHNNSGTSAPSAPSNSVTPEAPTVTIDPSDDASLYTCSGCNLVANGNGMNVGSYIQGAVKFPSSSISGTVTYANLTVNPYGLPLDNLYIDVYGFTSTSGVIDAASANAGTYIGTWKLPPILGYGKDAYFDVTSFVAANAAAPYIGFNLRAPSGGVLLFSSIETNYGHPSQLLVTLSALPAVTIPDAPNIGTATAGNAQATVTFTAPAGNGGAAVDGYTVVSNPAGGTDSNAGSTGLSHTITGLTNGMPYTFMVTAHNSAGTSLPSAASNSVTPAAPLPDAPIIGTAIAGNAQAWASFSAPANDGGSPIIGYTVTSDPVGGVDSNAGTATLTHVITGLANGTAYTFTVHATSVLGNSAESAASASVTPSAVPPISGTTLTDNGDGTVTDSTTGLTWMRCAIGQTWDGTTCTGTASTYTWDQAMALTSSFAGHSDWRMPSPWELQTIVDYGAINPAINIRAFPATPADNFWTASSDSPDPAIAWQVILIDGSSVYGNKSDSYDVRLVRGGQPVGFLTTPTVDFTDNGDGTETHLKTGLTWMRCAMGQIWDGTTCTGTATTYTWDQALALTSGFAGHSDWRLPSEQELESIVEYGASYPAINSTLFPATPPYNFWSATSSLLPDGAWIVVFNVGYSTTFIKTNNYYVRLVRGGQSFGSFALNVSEVGSGSGTVTSSPTAISCGTTCSSNFNAAAGSVTLTSTPDAGSLFSGWSGACSGMGDCTVTMDAAKNVTATFSIANNIPDAFAFTGQSGVAPSTLITSSVITVSGIDAAAPIAISNCTGMNCAYSTDSGTTWQSSAGTVTNGSSVIVRMTSSASNSTTISLALNISGVTGTFSITTLAAAPGVDLIPTALGTAASTIVTGTTLAITDTVQNHGASNMTATSIVVKYYLSTDVTITAADKLLGSRTIAKAAMTSGASSTATTTLTVPATVLPASAASGTFYIGVIADATNAQAESNETNNTRASNGTVTVRRAGVDLVPTALSTPANSVIGGNGIAVSDTVANQGPSNMTAARIVVKYYLSTDATITVTDKPLGQRTIAKSALSAGAINTASTTFSIPAATTTGNYYIGMIVDATKLQAETNEANNTRAIVGPISVIKPGVDLVSTALNSSVGEVARGDNLTVGDTLLNQGSRNVTAANITVKYYLSTDNIITAADRLIGSRILPASALTAGASSPGITSLTVPASTPVRTYTLGMVVDATNAQVETIETNNTRTGGTINVTLPAPPAPASRLNDTGQTWCFSTLGLSCDIAGIPPGQDATFGRDYKAIHNTLAKVGGGMAGFDYTKLGANGAPLAIQNQPWGHDTSGYDNGSEALGTKWNCVKDNVTALVWEVKTNVFAFNPTPDLRDMNLSYSWYDSNSSTNGGNVGYGFGDTETYTTNVNAIALCGYTDWRLPSVRELHALTNKGLSGVSAPAIDASYFPNTVISNYWTASPYAPLPADAWFVYSGNGGFGFENKTGSNFVRLVRGAKF